MTGPRFFAEALAEYEDAVVYYEKREEGLGARLIQEFDEAVAVALEYPDAFASVPEAPVAFGPSLGDAQDLSDQIGLHRARRGASPGCGVPCASPSRLLAGKAQPVGALRALPSGCHEPAVRGGMARDEEGGAGSRRISGWCAVRSRLAKSCRTSPACLRFPPPPLFVIITVVYGAGVRQVRPSVRMFSRSKTALAAGQPRRAAPPALGAPAAAVSSVAIPPAVAKAPTRIPWADLSSGSSASMSCAANAAAAA